MIIRSSLGLSFGVVFSVLLFKRRAWPVWLGTGFGAGRAWEEADGRFTYSGRVQLLSSTCAKHGNDSSMTNINTSILPSR